jgi:hypothetical protein
MRYDKVRIKTLICNIGPEIKKRQVEKPAFSLISFLLTKSKSMKKSTLQMWAFFQ